MNKPLLIGIGVIAVILLIVIVRKATNSSVTVTSSVGQNPNSANSGATCPDGNPQVYDPVQKQFCCYQSGVCEDGDSRQKHGLPTS